jgi:hypothetical protein
VIWNSRVDKVLGSPKYLQHHKCKDNFVSVGLHMALREKFLNVASERKCPARQTEEFLWISHHDTQLHRRELHRSKHAFVRFRHHRLRREKESAEHDLRFGNATTTNVSQNNDHRISPPRGYNNKNHEFERSVIGPSLQAGVLDGAPFLIGRTNQNPNIYFQHCE